jgi:hypothetical protein
LPSPAAAVVLLRLAELAELDRLSKPSADRLARDCAMSAEDLDSARDELSAAGLVLVIRGRRPARVTCWLTPGPAGAGEG